MNYENFRALTAVDFEYFHFIYIRDFSAKQIAEMKSLSSIAVSRPPYNFTVVTGC